MTDNSCDNLCGAGESCISGSCQTTAECTSGSCCNTATGEYRPSSYVCMEGNQYECVGGCGGTVYLEDVDEEGNVIYLTELDFKPSDSPFMTQVNTDRFLFRGRNETEFIFELDIS